MSIERMSFGNKANNKISFLVALMAIFIMFGIFGIMGGVVTNADINEKLNRYETTKAKIVDYRVETKYARKLGTTRHYYPIYSYKVDDKTYEYESKASSTSKKTGTTIIYYDPKKPYKVITVEEKYTGVVLIVAGSVFLFIGIITLMSISIVFKKKRLNQRP